MKRKTIYLLVILILVVGCSKKEIEQKNNEEKEPIVEPIIEPEPTPEPIIEPPKYVDNNNTPVSLYYNGKKISEMKTNIKVGKDIAFLKVYLSDEEYLPSGTFAQNFHDKFIEYNKDNNLKIGYNLSYDIEDGRHFSQTIKHVVDNYDYEGYILIFVYDDYDLYKNNKIFKHVDIEEETDDNIFSSIKLYGEAASGDITSKITLTVFTYDTDDDFDENGEYRGNSKYSMTICEIGKTC